MDHQNDLTAKRRRLPLPLASNSPRTRSVVIATGLLILGITPFAAARTGSNLREGGRNGTATRETQIIAHIRSPQAPPRGLSEGPHHPGLRAAPANRGGAGRWPDLRLPLGRGGLVRQAPATEPVPARQQPEQR